MKTIRQIGSIAFILGLFVSIFAGLPWHVLTADDPPVPWWLRISIFSFLAGILVVLATVAIEQKKIKTPAGIPSAEQTVSDIIISNADSVPGKQINQILGLVQGHTVYAIWLGKDLSALIRLILGGELTEYTEMMGNARRLATDILLAEASELNADAIINVRYMTTSVIGSAAELLVYGTAVKLT